MKKLLSLLLTLALIVSLAAPGIPLRVNAAEAEEEITETQAADAPESAAPETEPVETEAPETAPVETAAPETEPAETVPETAAQEAPVFETDEVPAPAITMTWDLMAQYISGTNALLIGGAVPGSTGVFGKVRCVLMNADLTPLGEAEKTADPAPADQQYFNFDVSTDFGITLKPATEYFFRFTVEFDGQSYESENAGFRTVGAISTFEELKAVASGTYTQRTMIEWEGQGPLVIEEDLTLPANVYLSAQDMEVPAGVTLTAPEAEFNVQTLTVNGAMGAKRATVWGDITINGSYLCHGDITMESPATAAGLENVELVNEWSRIILKRDVSSLSDIKAVIAEADASTVTGAVYLMEYSAPRDGELVIDEPLMIPANCELRTPRKTTIPENSILVVDGRFCPNEALVIEGSLVNNSDIYLSYYGTTVVTLAEGADYSGRGRINTSFGDPSVGTPEELLIGFDLSQFDISYSDSGFGWEARLSANTGADSFANFAELKELASRTYTQWTRAEYTGSGPLVIEEDLTLPENLALMVRELHVPAGVTFDAQQYNNINTDVLTVDGTMNGSQVFVDQALTVNGVYNNYGDLTLSAEAQATGLDKVVKCNGWSEICRRYFVATLDEIKAVIAGANAETNPDIRYYAGFETEDGSGLLIGESITVPVNCTIQASEKVTVAAGCTLTLDGQFQAFGELVTAGTLVNNNNVFIAGYEGASMTLAGGQYEGHGTISVSGAAPEDALIGFDLSDFEISNFGGDYWMLEYVGNLPKLSAPTNPEWGFRHYQTMENGSLVWKTESRPGFISWKPAAPYQAEFEIRVYRAGETEACATYVHHFGSTDMPEWLSIDNFAAEEVMETGTYYFTVMAKGDGINFKNSDIVTSETWDYVKPAAKLGPCTAPAWDWPNATWRWPAELGEKGLHMAEFYYAPTADAEPHRIGGSWTFEVREPSTWIPDSYIQENGPGCYYFRVRALSSDITRICNGDWSAMSAAFNLTQAYGDVETELDEILNSGASNEEKVDAIRDMDTQELKDAMLSGGNVVDKVSRLEKDAAGGAASVTVTPDVPAFDAGDVSVIGANLNVRSDADRGVTLVVDKPEKEHVLSDVYNNALAVKFSMDLDNVPGSEDLEVPVQITLPVPDTLDPEFLVILHYHTDGTYEEILPHIYSESGKLYARFVLTSFSDFVMTVKNAPAECRHQWGQWTETKAPTCTEKGEETRTCALCKETETRETEAKGHTAVTDAAVPATCTETGLTEGSHCSVCGEILAAQEIIPALGHDFGEWTESKAATCTEKGEEHRDCAHCDEFETRETEALGHAWGQAVWTWNDDFTASVTFTCANDETHVETVDAVVESEVTTEPACETEGERTYTATAEFGEEIYTDTATEVIPAKGHNYEDGTCTDCGEADPNAAAPVYRLYNAFTLEHLFVSSENEYNTLGAAGWVQEGVAWYAPQSGEPVYRLYNAYTDGHFYTVSESEKDQCIANGWIYDGVVSFNADPESGVPIYRMFNPFEEKNYHHYTASIIERDTLAAAGWVYEGVAWYAASAGSGAHNFRQTSRVEAGCFEDGYIRYRCADCGEEYELVLPAPGFHTPGDWVVVQNPTEAETGLRQRSCLKCGTVLEKEILDRLESEARNYTVDLGGAETTVWGRIDYDMEDEIFRLLNEYRAENGLAPLGRTKELSEGANIRGPELAVLFSHTRPNGEDCFTVAPSSRGENIAAGYRTAEAVIAGWKASPGHNANMLRESFENVGIGVFVCPGSPYGVYCVQLFG